MDRQKDFFKPDEIRALANSFQQSRILLSAVELDLFTVLDRHMLTSTEVAKQINADERATDRLMNALVALGFVRKVKNKFYNIEHASQYLVKGKPEFMGGLFHSIGLWDTWGNLTETVQAGKSVSKKHPSNSRIDWLESFIGAMHYKGIKEAKLTSMMLDLTDVNRMLDVGGGSGVFSMEFIKKKPNIQAVVFDLPEVIPITQRYVEDENMSSKFSFIGGNYLEDNFIGEYDLIFLSAIVHINSFDENKKLIKKCFDALNPNGQIVIKDWVMSEDRVEPEGGAYFALNMLVGTENGDTYTESEMKDWFNYAGISKIERKDTGFGSSILIGYKK
jgi:2-polyprenyl-3-methyl-5-hydroxy-6-metoxy-1,4-benzoquinol methylase